MAIAPFLAMTAAEMYAVFSLPEKVAWMACHFSPYGLGLSNLPQSLPPGSLLMVDDITPPHGHDPVQMARQLSACVEDLQCSGVLMDFQRAGCDETQAIARHLSEALPCPVAVSAGYAQGLDCAVFLPPVPPSVPLEDHLLSWKNRDIWLELGLEGEILTLTEDGCKVVPLLPSHAEEVGFQDAMLHCHYTVETNKNTAKFTLWRTKEDLQDLLQEAELSGVVRSVALFQEIALKGILFGPASLRS